MRTKILIGLVAVAVWIAAIVGKHYWPDLDTGAIVGAAQSTIAGLGLYHFGTMERPTGSSDGNQRGHALPLMLATVAALAVLVGCSGLNVSWVATASYNTPAVTQAVMTPGMAKPSPSAATTTSAGGGT